MAAFDLLHPSPQHVFAFLLAALLAAVPAVYSRVLRRRTPSLPENGPYNDIQPLANLDWSSEDPIRLRPFKPKYYLTMGTEGHSELILQKLIIPAQSNTTIDELVAIDKTYLDRIKLRRELISHSSNEVLACLPGAEPMVNELYAWLFAVYLPRRFPTMYTLITPASSNTKKGRNLNLRNSVTSESIPVEPPEDPIEALKTICSHIDTDFLLLTPQPLSTTQEPLTSIAAAIGAENSTQSEQKYHLAAYATCFPSGFRSRDKLGLPLNLIHKPVPSYDIKLEKSMDRFFASIPIGKVVKRANWTISEAGVLHVPSGNHIHVEDFRDGPHGEADADSSEDTEKLGMSVQEMMDAEVQKQKDKLDVSKCKLRTERQTLHRLPQSKALVFGFKTYTYGLDEIKAEEGMAETLIEAIEGLDSVIPEIGMYKRKVVWGQKVTEYLRQGTVAT